ncbi:M56 family metallopeptidase [Nocardioides speluncae]|uniref:M56 family metallopeptidase n=1 Tax=Nocardioides speluncae TaxID=2670337 RepID=UPI000D68F31B|nr:M56 family metallopeptidase [Nocardioides speluncae]
MTTTLALFAVAALMGSVAGIPLARARWAGHAPRLAVALWHALCFGVVSSVVLGGLALALPVLPQVITGGLSDFLARCAMALHTELAAPRPAFLGAAGLLLALAAGTRLLRGLMAAAREAKRGRRHQLDRLTLVGHLLPSDHRERLVLLDDARPAAYCLPGRRRGRATIVISRGALELLGDDQVDLLLAHERAHLRQRHHLATRLTAALTTSFGWVPLFRLASGQVPLLLEMAADDEAVRLTTRRHSAQTTARRRLADAVVNLATAQTPTPAAAFSAAGGSALARVQRLSRPPERLGLAHTTLLTAGVGVILAGPLLVATAPVLCAAAMDICPIALA